MCLPSVVGRRIKYEYIAFSALNGVVAVKILEI
jgi:hypothetical protein